MAPELYRKDTRGPMKSIVILIATFNTLIATAAVSDIKDHNYVCTHITKQEALVFKTTTPQKIWRTGLTEKGEIKIKSAFELSEIKINTEAINKEGQVASFNALLTKNYEIKGLFAKDTDGDLPLTVITSYKPDGKQSQIRDSYNCSMEKADITLKLGAVTE